MVARCLIPQRDVTLCDAATKEFTRSAGDLAQVCSRSCTLLLRCSAFCFYPFRKCAFDSGGAPGAMPLEGGTTRRELGRRQQDVSGDPSKSGCPSMISGDRGSERVREDDAAVIVHREEMSFERCVVRRARSEAIRRRDSLVRVGQPPRLDVPRHEQSRRRKAYLAGAKPAEHACEIGPRQDRSSEALLGEPDDHGLRRLGGP